MKDRVPAKLAGLVDAARRDGPSLERLSRIAEATAAREVAEKATPAPASALRAFLRPRGVGMLAIAMVAVFGTAATKHVVDARHAPSVTAPQVVIPSESTPSEQPAHTTESGVADAVVHAPEIPSIDVRSLPNPKAPPEARKVGIDGASPESREPMSEGALLHRAHAAMASDPAQALALTAEHGRRFPAGMLIQEREVMAIEALVRLQRPGEARARAATFLSNYPSSAYRRRVDDALGAARPVGATTSPTETP